LIRLRCFATTGADFERKRIMMKKAGGWLASVCALAVFTGCDDGGGGSGNGGDFGNNNPDRYVVVGDSISVEGNADAWPARLAGQLGKEVVNEAHGQGGPRAVDSISHVDSVLKEYQPGYLLIFYGANDVIMGEDPAQIVEALREMVRLAKANKTVPVVATLTPMTDGHSIFDGAAKALSGEIVGMAADEGAKVAHLDKAFGDGSGLLEEDGLHPNPEGRQLIAETFRKAAR
jgi:lysophospholipase L1-like esterase